MLKLMRLIFAVCASAGLIATASAQNSPPSTGPTNPTVIKPTERTPPEIVLNPTLEECRQGWSPGLRWPQDVFDQFCANQKASK